MTEGDRDNSGELSSFLHLTGWRPLVLALIAGLAGAIGLFGALSAPAEFQARYILRVGAAVDDDLTPQEVDIFVDEIVQAARLPRIQNQVLDATGLVEEDDYDITINQSPSSTTTIDINVVSDSPENAQAVAIETGIAALTLTLENELRALEVGADQLESQRRANDERITELTVEARLNPATAYNLAVQALIDRGIEEDNPPVCTDDDGAVEACPPPSKTTKELEDEVNRLAPLEREYQRLIAVVDAQTAELTARQSSIGEAAASLADLEDERENPEVMAEVVTEETSRIAGLLTGLLLFAVPAALLVIFAFVIFDLIRKKPAPEVPLRRAEDFNAAGVLEAQGQRALPEATKVTPLVVVDEELDASVETDVLATEEEVIEESDDDHGDDDGDEPKAKKRSKDGRWGRDASSKAG